MSANSRHFQRQSTPATPISRASQLGLDVEQFVGGILFGMGDAELAGELVMEPIGTHSIIRCPL
jgi:hypothetical protein